MKANHIPITQEQFDRIYRSTGWDIQEISLEELKVIPKICRPSDHLGAFISGSIRQPKVLNGKSSIAAFELLVFESNPKPEWNEGPVNAYHYVIHKSGHPTIPYILSGPYYEETLIGHHPEGLDLSVYKQQKD